MKDIRTKFKKHQTFKIFIILQELIGVTCTWCKEAYHNKPECFSQIKLDERCHMGVLHDLIVPPSWVVRRPGVHRQHDDLTKKAKVIFSKCFHYLFICLFNQ